MEWVPCKQVADGEHGCDTECRAKELLEACAFPERPPVWWDRNVLQLSIRYMRMQLYIASAYA